MTLHPAKQHSIGMTAFYLQELPFIDCQCDVRHIFMSDLHNALIIIIYI